MTVQNLDAACAELGSKLGKLGNKPKDTENSITKALGVLEEQGVYAMFLYLHAREKQWGEAASKELAAFLREQPSSSAPLLAPADGAEDENRRLEAVRLLSTHLDKLLFARDLLHRALVYARYHAKARDAGRKERSS